MYQSICYSRIQLSQSHLFWREAGQGITIVFLHGQGQDGSQWLSVVQELSEQYHCLIVDLPGCGESDQFPGHYSIQAMTEILAEYLQALKVGRIYLVGHSVGAWIAANYALKYLERVQGLVLISPEGVQVPGLQSQQQWMRSLVQSPSFSYFWLNLVQPFASLLGQRKRVNRWLEYRRELFRSPGSCQLLYGRRWAEYQAELLNDQLPHLSRPLMILQGSEVEAIPQAQSEIYSQLAPLTQIHTVPLAGSNLPLEAPEATLEYIRDFTLGVSCSQVNSSYGSS